MKPPISLKGGWETTKVPGAGRSFRAFGRSWHDAAQGTDEQTSVLRVLV